VNALYFDVETEAREDAVQWIEPFEPPGNYKDPEKIEALRLKYEAASLASAALDALTARVIAIGWKEAGHLAPFAMITGPEPFLLQSFWAEVMKEDRLRPLVGWNSEGFDLPMLFRRSWANGIVPPPDLRAGRYWNSALSLDLMQFWNLGQYGRGYLSLDQAARFLGLPPKLGQGEDFAALLRTDPEAAKEYLQRDVDLVEWIHRIVMQGAR